MQKIKFDGDDFKKEKKSLPVTATFSLKGWRKLKKKKEYMSNIYIKI